MPECHWADLKEGPKVALFIFPRYSCFRVSLFLVPHLNILSATLLQQREGVSKQAFWLGTASIGAQLSLLEQAIESPRSTPAFP